MVIRIVITCVYTGMKAKCFYCCYYRVKQNRIHGAYFVSYFFHARSSARHYLRFRNSQTNFFVTQLAIVMMQHFELFVHWSLLSRQGGAFFIYAADQHCVEISAQFLSLEMLCFQ